MVGCGNLGNFYFQSILKYFKEIELKLYTVDPFTKLSSNDSLLNITHFTSLNDVLDNQIDLAIVTTCSDVRYQLTKQILENFSVKYLILEKILFQNEQEYVEIDNLLKQHQVTTWVNCPRRTYQCYRDLKQMLIDQSLQITKFIVTGVNWGLACNIMHFLDLYVYLSEDDSFNLESVNQLQLHPSKRANFYEFEGTIRSTDDKINISCQVDSASQGFKLQKYIQLTDGKEIFINNIGGQLELGQESNYFKIPYISDFIGLYIKDILTSGKCNLTDYQESMKIHLKLITLFKSEFKQHQIENCPVT